jgi:hypothetical protein
MEYNAINQNKKSICTCRRIMILLLFCIALAFILIKIKLKLDSKNNKELTLEDKIYSLAGFKPYTSHTVEIQKNPKKPKGVYFQYNNGCILYSLINLGYINENDIPLSMKNYKSHTYFQDEKTHINLLKETLSLIDLAQLWINVGGESHYIKNNKIIPLEIIKNQVYDILKNYIESNDKKYEDVKPAFNIVKNHTRFASVIGKYPVKPLLLSQCDFKDKIEKLNLKSAIDKGFIVKGDVVFVLNHFIVFDGIIEENSKKFYLFIDSLSPLYERVKKESMEGCIIEYNKGIIKSPENGALINIEQTNEKSIGILKLLFK